MSTFLRISLSPSGMRSTRVTLLFGALFAVFFLFAAVNGHGPEDDLEDDDATSSSRFSSTEESQPTSTKSVELPTFTVMQPPRLADQQPTSAIKRFGQSL